MILAIIHCNYYSKDITEDCFGVDFNLLSNYTAEVTSELEELNKFATKEITQRAKKYEHSKAQEKVFGLVESYFEEGNKGTLTYYGEDKAVIRVHKNGVAYENTYIREEFDYND